MKFDEIYKPPFYEVLDFWVYTQGDVRCFDWIARVDSRTRKELIRILNGNSKKRVKHEVKYDKGIVSIKGVNIMLLRGWGHLTGRGALNLSPEEAIEIQDDFGEWIVKKLKQEI